MMGVYDMNGKAKPNQVGKDIGFVGSFYNGFETKAAAVSPHSKEVANTSSLNETGYDGDSWDNLYKYCENLDKDKNWIMPDVNELSLIYLNSKLIYGSNAAVNRWFFSRSQLDSSPTSSDFRTLVDFVSSSGGNRYSLNRATMYSHGPYVRCVRRTELK